MVVELCVNTDLHPSIPRERRGGVCGGGVGLRTLCRHKIGNNGPSTRTSIMREIWAGFTHGACAATIFSTRHAANP